MIVQAPRVQGSMNDGPTLQLRFVKSKNENHLPEAVRRHLADSPLDLAATLCRVAQSRSHGQDASGALIAVARRQGAPGAWRFLHENRIDPRYLLSALGRSVDDQRVRRMLVRVLEPGIEQFAPHLDSFFAEELKAAEELRADSMSPYPRSPAHDLEHARGEFAVALRDTRIASSNRRPGADAAASEDTRHKREDALLRYGAAVKAMIAAGQAHLLARQDALAYAAYLYQAHELMYYNGAVEMTEAAEEAEGSVAIRFLQRHNVSFRAMARADARRRNAFPADFPLKLFRSYQNDALAQTAAAIVMEQARVELCYDVASENLSAYSLLVAAPREGFLAQLAARSEHVGESLLAYADSVQAYVRENGVEDLSDMDLRALIVGGRATSPDQHPHLGTHTQSVRDRLARNGYMEKELAGHGRLPKLLDTGSGRYDPIVAQLLDASVQFVSSASAFGKHRTARGILAPQSITGVHIGSGRRAYRTTFSFGNEGASVVQLLALEGLDIAADARSLKPGGEHFLFDKHGALELWTRRAIGTNGFHVVHDDGGVLSVRLVAWQVVRDALLSGDVRDLLVTPNDSRRGDLRYYEARSIWVKYNLSSGRWIAHAGESPLSMPARSPNEMYARR
jgi:hypothetical protein